MASEVLTSATGGCWLSRVCATDAASLSTSVTAFVSVVSAASPAYIHQTLSNTVGVYLFSKERVLINPYFKAIKIYFVFIHINYYEMK